MKGDTMNNDKIKTEEIKQNKLIDVLKEKVKYIQDNAAAFTFLTTTAIVIGGVILRVIAYLIEYGKTKYYNISSLLIDVTGDNVLYDLFAKGVFVLLFILLNIILFFVWSGKSKKRAKVGFSLPLVLSPDLILAFYLVFDNLRGIKYSILEIGIFLVVGFLLGVILFFWGIYNGICKYYSNIKQEENSKEEIKKEVTKKSEKETENKTKTGESNLKILKANILIFTFLLVIGSIFFIFFGYYIADSQSKFKIINSDSDTYYAVIYENQDKYVITPCKIEDSLVDFAKDDTKQEIDRLGITYKWMQKKA